MRKTKYALLVERIGIFSDSGILPERIMTREELADLLGVSPRSITRWLSEEAPLAMFLATERIVEDIEAKSNKARQ